MQINLGNEAPIMNKTITAILANGGYMAPLICTFIGVAIGFAFGRSRSQVRRHAPYGAARRAPSFQDHGSSFQNQGEARLSRELRKHFRTPDYHLMNHITLRMQDGTTQIDHILVSRFGVFVIETKHYKGLILANGAQAKWTQVLSQWKFQFQNPIFQNVRHVQAVRELLNFLPAGAIKSIVVFTGDAEFKTGVPPGVFNLPGLVNHISMQTIEVMPLHQMQFCVGRIEAARLAITNETDVEHIEHLRRKYGNAA